MTSWTINLKGVGIPHGIEGESKAATGSKFERPLIPRGGIGFIGGLCDLAGRRALCCRKWTFFRRLLSGEVEI